MPLPNIPVPQFPNVPIGPGVPPMLRNALAAAIGPVTRMLGDALGIFSTQQVQLWGLYDQSGNPALVADSCISVGYAKEWRISTYPLEAGAFQSYNKVETPGDPRLVLAKSGNDGERADFLNTLDTITGSLDLYTVVTPTVSYDSVNVTRYDYSRRADQGAQIIVASIVLEQVRITATQDFTSTKSDSGSSTVNDGTVQYTGPLPNAPDPGDVR